MLLDEVVRASRATATTRSRKAKVALLAEVLARSTRDDNRVVAAYLSGRLLQRRTGVGWRSLAVLPDPAESPTLDVLEVDAALERVAALSGPGSARARADAVSALFARATTEEQEWLRAVVTGQVRQGALDAVLQEAVALAADVPLAAVRRAAMLSGSTVEVVTTALDGGEEALTGIGLQVGRPVLPMLASSAPDTPAAMTKAAGDGPVALEAKLDGIRLQVHRRGDDVRVFTRSLDDITSRLPGVTALVRALPASTLVLDGEAMALDAAGRPRPFQEISSRVATTAVDASGEEVAITPYFFDLLHLDGRDLLDSPASERRAELERVVPAEHLTRRVVTDSVEVATAFVDEVLAAGHEGAVVKTLGSPYDAGRRGAAWVKVKPVHTLDLVVLAVEWGSGRRRGFLSNIHLGARSPDGDFIMLGKTFKGMTDEMLAWQTERFLSLETRREGHVVHVRPEQVVEIAFDGVQRSTRYPGGVALRFARVVRYRDDKTAEEADALDTVTALHPARRDTGE